MPLHPTWDDIALRLILTVIAGGVIGFDRSVSGHAAGLRTTVLVGLAAAVAMLQANVLLPVDGKPPGSFVEMDLMRLPLGILTGVGFIGGGAILKRGDLVVGVTTAATMWMVTVIGLCFGGGQIGLGAGGTLLAFLTLWSMKQLDARIPRDRHADVVIRAESALSAAKDLAALLAPLGFRVVLRGDSAGAEPAERRVAFAISWRRPERAGPPLDLMALLGARFAVLSFEISGETEH